MKLKDAIIEKLRTRRAATCGSAGALYWANRQTRANRDKLARPIWAYYAKEQYSRRTARVYSGSWSDDRYLCDNWPAWREIGDSCDIVRDLPIGWYTDQWEDETIRGYVLQLPARDGIPCYVPGTYCTGWDGVTVWPLDQYETADEAARAADRYAEIEAEQSREFYAKDASERQIDECHERARKCIADFRKLKDEIKGAAYTPAVCSTIQNKLKELRVDVSREIKRVKELRADYWRVVI